MDKLRFKTFGTKLAPLVAPLCIAVLWETVRRTSGVNPSLLPPLDRVLSRAVRLLFDVAFLHHWFATIARVAAGFCCASLGGTLAGLAMGYNRTLFRVLVPAVDFFRSIPVTTLYPVFVVVAGIGDVSKIGMIVTGTVFVVALNAAYGVSRGSETRRALARLYGATRWQLLTRVVVMEALPQIFVGLRVSVSLSIVVSILTEFFMGSKYGIGQRIMETYSTYLLTEMYALILWAGVTGYALNRGMALLERLAVPWAEVRQP